ncbi:hypothetical protein [Rhizomonospora bruguierae]|uniref:hypothetical protein n=1 Tax=Rhizomonospora bruguierae TaxID=1581705 RepID=UPI001BCF8937|nr:hypothetical protein [Micromonospora sp. NBRC 107566]
MYVIRGTFIGGVQHHRSGQGQLHQSVTATGHHRPGDGVVMKVKKELERADLFGIGEPHRRFDGSGRDHRALPDGRELSKLNGNGSPAIVAVRFAWWYLRPAA